MSLNGIIRYYTWEDLKDDPNDRLGDGRLDKLLMFVEEKNIEVLTDMFIYRKELTEIGVNLINKECTVQRFKYSSEDETAADSIESDIRAYAKKLSILIHDVRATLDYNIIAKKANEGMLYVTEKVVIPNSISDMEALIYTYIDNLDSMGKTIILTDPYLYSSTDNDYVNRLTGILKRTAAKEIKSFMPLARKNEVYRDLQSKLVDTTFTFIKYDNCHDRFWLCPETKKGFCMGTSLNGLGKKVFRIDMLNEGEVQILLDELQ